MTWRRRSFRMVMFALLGWTGGGILMHVFRPEKINEGMLLGLCLGLMCHVVDILWKALGCYEGRASGPCTNCPSRGRWNRFCVNHRLAACFLACWFAGFLFIMAHLLFALFGFTMLEFLDHGSAFISWLAAPFVAAVESFYRFMRRV